MLGSNRVRCAAALAVLAALSSSGRAQQDRRYALLVGVADYKGTEFSNLRFTENDVAALAAVLRGDGYRRVVLLTQSEAFNRRDQELFPTAANIRLQLRALLAGRAEADSVLVAFAGHGVTLRADRQFYYCPQRSDLDDPKSLIPLGEVYDALKECKAGARVLIVDACRNDPLASRTRSEARLESVTRPVLARPPGGVAALFSCSEGEKAFESERLKHGVFFHHLLEGMRGKAANPKGEVTLENLAGYVKDSVPDAVAEQFGPRAQQRPHLLSDVSGRVTLVRARNATDRAGTVWRGHITQNGFDKPFPGAVRISRHTGDRIEGEVSWHVPGRDPAAVTFEGTLSGEVLHFETSRVIRGPVVAPSVFTGRLKDGTMSGRWRYSQEANGTFSFTLAP